MTYTPKVNDFVIWERHGLRDEGWVYFVSTPTEDKRGFTKTARYLTIETGIRRKPECQYEKNNPHKYVHILLCCYESQWSELKYVKRGKVRKMIQSYQNLTNISTILNQSKTLTQDSNMV